MSFDSTLQKQNHLCKDVKEKSQLRVSQSFLLYILTFLFHVYSHSMVEGGFEEMS